MLKVYNKENVAKMERLYEKYKYVMQSEAFHILFDTMEAEDAVQQSFVKIAKCLDRIDESNPAMTCNFMKVVARNVAKDMYKKKLYLNSDEEASEWIDDSKIHRTTGVQQLVITKEATGVIMKAIMELPEIYRDVLLLEKVYGYTREESMRILNANYETVKKRLTRAKIKLAEALKKEGIDDGIIND